MELRVHYRLGVGQDLCVTDYRVARSAEQLEAIHVDLGEEGATILYIEDMDLKPTIDKITSLLESGMPMGGKYGEEEPTRYYYIDEDGYFYTGNGTITSVPTSPIEGDTRLTINELGERIQAHFYAMGSEELKRDMDMIDQAYAMMFPVVKETPIVEEASPYIEETTPVDQFKPAAGIYLTQGQLLSLFNLLDECVAELFIQDHPGTEEALSSLYRAMDTAGQKEVRNMDLWDYIEEGHNE